MSIVITCDLIVIRRVTSIKNNDYSKIEIYKKIWKLKVSKGYIY